jgi:hypothetical protein
MSVNAFKPPKAREMFSTASNWPPMRRPVVAA